MGFMLPEMQLPMPRKAKRQKFSHNKQVDLSGRWGRFWEARLARLRYSFWSNPVGWAVVAAGCAGSMILGYLGSGPEKKLEKRSMTTIISKQKTVVSRVLKI